MYYQHPEKGRMFFFFFGNVTEDELTKILDEYMTKESWKGRVEKIIYDRAKTTDPGEGCGNAASARPRDIDTFQAWLAVCPLLWGVFW